MIAAQIVVESAQLVARGLPAEARRVIDEGLTSATRDGDAKGEALLARHGAVFAMREGDLDLAESYAKRGMAANDKDPLAYLVMIEVLKRRGGVEAMRPLVVKCRALAEAAGNASVLEILAAMDRQVR